MKAMSAQRENALFHFYFPTLSTQSSFIGLSTLCPMKILSTHPTPGLRTMIAILAFIQHLQCPTYHTLNFAHNKSNPYNTSAR